MSSPSPSIFLKRLDNGSTIEAEAISAGMNGIIVALKMVSSDGNILSETSLAQNPEITTARDRLMAELQKAHFSLWEGGISGNAFLHMLHTPSQQAGQAVDASTVDVIALAKPALQSARFKEPHVMMLERERAAEAAEKAAIAQKLEAVRGILLAATADGKTITSGNVETVVNQMGKPTRFSVRRGDMIARLTQTIRQEGSISADNVDKVIGDIGQNFTTQYLS